MRIWQWWSWSSLYSCHAESWTRSRTCSWNILDPGITLEQLLNFRFKFMRMASQYLMVLVAVQHLSYPQLVLLTM
jgi:hypothetical protein